METIIKFIYKSALYLWLFICGIFFIYYCFLYITHNGVGNIFSYAPTSVIDFSIDFKQQPVTINYSYKVNQKKYSGAQEVAVEVAEEIQNTEITILYNKTFPMISEIKDISGNSSKLNECIWKMGLTFIGFLFAFLILKFADHEKWIGVYARGEYKSRKQRERT